LSFKEILARLINRTPHANALDVDFALVGRAGRDRIVIPDNFSASLYASGDHDTGLVRQYLPDVLGIREGLDGFRDPRIEAVPASGKTARAELGIGLAQLIAAFNDEVHHGIRATDTFRLCVARETQGQSNDKALGSHSYSGLRLPNLNPKKTPSVKI
jgi:hypothetical protein